jgi:multiple sugar transport system permease protein
MRANTVRELKRTATGLAFVSPWLVGFGGLTLLPVALSLYYSFCDFSLLQPPVPVGWDNYRQLMSDPVFWRSLRTTAYYALLALPAGMLVSLGLALMLNAGNRGQGFYRTVVFLPSLVPAVASAMLWSWVFNKKLGLLNVLLDLVGIPGPGWLTQPEWVIPALALMSLWGVGYTVVIYLAGLQDVPAELYEAAEIDGALGWRRLWHVTLPVLSPVIFFNLVMALIGSLQILTTPYVMTGGGPARASYFYTMYLYDNAFVHLKMGYASAMAWVQLLMILALTGLAFWSSRRWVHYQGK